MSIDKKRQRYKAFCKAAEHYDGDERILSMRAIKHHRGASLYDHSRHVAWQCWCLVRMLPWIFDVDSMMRIAFLHDYFMYDRMGLFSRRCHGYIHPVIAAENARRDFGISDKEYMAIITHMWPEVFWCLPTSKEAWVLSIADKICAIQEYFGCGKKWAVV